MEDEAFLAAIAEDPADEARRLVYADWLDDRSDPRAEFLRVEAAMHGRPVYRARGRRLGLHLIEPHPRHLREGILEPGDAAHRAEGSR